MMVPDTLHQLLFEAVSAVRNLSSGYDLNMNVWIWRDVVHGQASVSLAGAWLVARRPFNHRALTTDYFEEHIQYHYGDSIKQMVEGHRMEVINCMRQGRFLQAHAMLYGDWKWNPTKKGIPIATPHTPAWDILMLASVVVRDTLVMEPVEHQCADLVSYERAARLLEAHGI